MDPSTNHEWDSIPDVERDRGDAAVLLVPGFGHDDRTRAVLHRMMVRQGFDHVSLAADLSPATDIAVQAEHLRSQVAVLRAVSGIRRVHLVGHNVGGIVVRYYLQVLRGADEGVDTVVTVGTPHHGVRSSDLGFAGGQLRPGSGLMALLRRTAHRPMPVHWINYLSGRDRLAGPGPGALLRLPYTTVANVAVTDADDLSLSLPPVVQRSVAHRLALAEGLDPASAHVIDDPLEPPAGDPLFGGCSPTLAALRSGHPSNPRWR